MGCSVILVDYKSIDKTLDYIEKCIKYLINEETRYFVIDNEETGSGRNQLEKRARYVSECKIDQYDVGEYCYNDAVIYYCAPHKNAGYAVGNNIGALISRKLFPENFLLISNNDIEFVHPIDLKFVEQKLKSAAIVAPDIINGNDRNHLNPMYMHSAWYNWVLVYLRPCRKHEAKKQLQKTFSGCFWFFNQYIFEKIKGFDEGTFMYYEEYIMSEKMRLNNKRMEFCDEIQVVHEHVFAESYNASEERRLKVTFDSNMYYERKYRHTPEWQIIVLKGLFNITNLLRRVCLMRK